MVPAIPAAIRSLRCRPLGWVLAVGLWMCAGTTHGAVVLDNTTLKTSLTTPATVSHTTGSGTDRLMLVGISLNRFDNTTLESVTGVTYSGQSLTRVGVQTNLNLTEAVLYIYALVNPPSGAANVVVTLNANPADGIVYGVATFTGVDQSSPYRAFTSATGTDTAPTITVSSATGELVFDTVVLRTSDFGASGSPGSGQSQLWKTYFNSRVGAGGSTKPGAASVVTTWTTATAVDWVVGAVSIKPASTVSADVATTQTGSSSVVAGANLTYTISVTNSGPNTATNIVVSDTIPTGATFYSASGSGSYSAGVVTWPGFNLASGASTTFTLVVTAPGSGTLTNSVSSTATTGDPDSTNNDGSTGGVVTTVTPSGTPGTGSTSCNTATNVATKTWSHTVPSGLNRLLLVGFSFSGTDRSVTSVTFGGASLTFVGTSSVHRRLELWKLVNPSVGTSNIVANWSGNKDVVMWSASFTNVDQTTPLGTFTTASGSSLTPSVTVSSVAGDVVVDLMAAAGDAGNISQGGSQTLICSGNTGTGGGDARGGGSYEAGASSVTMSWNLTNSKNWDIGAVTLRAATPTQADVATTQTGSATAIAGTSLSYTITVNNSGPATATNVFVSDTLPAGAAFVSATGGGTNNSGVVTWPTLATLAAGATTNFTLTITAPTSAGTITNVASSTATTSDPDASNNNGTASGAKVITTVSTLTIAGNVFEDVNYGGGAGRDKATSSGVARSSARVELFNASGTFLTFTNTDGSGNFTLSGAASGTNTVRVVNSSVTSSRTGYTASQLAVQTYRTTATNGSAVAVTDHVGGENPQLADAGNASTTLAALTNATTTVQSLTTAILTTNNLTGVNFGFTFSTIVNTNNSGQGSLRQFLSNANALSNTGLAQSGKTAGIENAIFMIPDGTARAGMNTTYASQFSSGVATIAPASALPTITDPIVLDATGQPGFTTTPIVQLSGTSAGAVSGFTITAGGSTVRGFVINWFNQSGIHLTTVGGNTVQGNYLGTDATGASAATNNQQGIYIYGVAGNTIGGTTAAARNVISGNRLRAVLLEGTGASNNIIQGNYVGLNAAGTTAIPNIIGIYCFDAPNNTIGGTAAGAGNVVSGNSQIGIYLVNSGTTGNSVQGNTIGLNAAGSATVANGSLGIDIITGAANNTIGGTASGAANIIAGNGAAGVRVSSNGGNGNLIQRNSIYGNTGLGIELGLSDGVTPNNGTVGSGPNNGMDYAIFTSMTLSGTNLTVAGYVGSAPGQATFGSSSVELFKADNSPADQNGEIISGDGNSVAHGEGRTYLGTITADASGNFNTTLGVSGLSVGDIVTGTATITANGTSEFGPNYTLVQADVATTQTGTTNAVAGGSITYTISVTNSGPSGATNVIVTDSLPTGVTFVSATGGGTNNSGVVTWPTLAALASGGATNFTLVVTAPTTNSTLTNVVSSSATTPDPDASNNNGTAAGAKVITTITVLTIAGNVFEDLNYGGGAGRDKATSSGVARSSARVELFNASGTFLTFTNTDASGNFTLSGAATGTNTVRVVNSSVTSSRTGYTSAQLAVQTYRTTATNGSAVAVTDHVGGENPQLADAGNASTTLAALTNATTTVQSLTTAILTTNNLTGVNFGFTFSTIVNTNDSGPGSLRQFLSNANALSNTGLAQSGKTAGIENAIFMIPDGTARAGMNTTYANQFSGGLATVSPGSALPAFTDPLVLDGTAQPGYAGTPIISLRGISAGAGVNGLTLTNGSGGSTIRGLLIARFGGNGVKIESGSAGNTIAGNYVGRYTASGTIGSAGEGNSSSGLRVLSANNTIGGTAAADRNLIGGNVEGIYLTGSSANNNSLLNNFIGVDVTGASAVGNTGRGVYVDTGASGNQIGQASYGNVLSGSGNIGLHIVGATCTNNVIRANYIGVNAAGTAAISNGAFGVAVDGGATGTLVGGTGAGQGNLISGNTGSTGSVARGGVYLNASNTTIQGNIIGLNATASATIPNGQSGVANNGGIYIYSGANNLIGGTTANAGNIIAGNFGDGIMSTYSGTSVFTALGNSIYSNTEQSIDLNDDGVTANDTGDGDTGPNNLQNFPLLTAALTSGSQVTVVGMLNSTASSYFRVEFFSSTTADANGYGPGQVYLGYANVTTDGSGNATFSTTMSASVAVGAYVSATATKSDAAFSTFTDTSEFAANVQARLPTTISGYVYLDANHNGIKDSSESGSGLTLYAKIFASTNASGPALQAVAVNSSSGLFTITNLSAGTYTLIIDNNNTLADVTPTLPAGWSGTEMPAQTRTVVVTTTDVNNQNFGLVNAITLSGKVFLDNGATGGTANDGIPNGAEAGKQGVTVKLTDSSGATTHDTATTDGAGNYSLLIPSALANGTVLKVVETTPSGFLSTGAGVGNTGGTYDRTTDTVTFTLTSGTVYTGVNFGDVPVNTFVNDSQQNGSAGNFVLHAHAFTAGSAGTVAFSVTNSPRPVIAGWSQVIYLDANGNGQFDAGDTIITAAISVNAGDKVSILVKDFIPGGTPYNAQDQLTVTALFTYTGASPALTATATRTDLTTAGRAGGATLALLKAADRSTALPGETITYTVTYANRSAETLGNIVIADEVPAFTTFVSAAASALPTGLSSVTISAPSVGSSGGIRWTFAGNLNPGATGTVSFAVTLAQ